MPNHNLMSVSNWMAYVVASLAVSQPQAPMKLVTLAQEEAIRSGIVFV